MLFETCSEITITSKRRRVVSPETPLSTDNEDPVAPTRTRIRKKQFSSNRVSAELNSILNTKEQAFFHDSVLLGAHSGECFFASKASLQPDLRGLTV